MKLNVGSGSGRFEGWLNVDLREEAKPDYVADVRKLPFDEGTVDLIYASHILEHMKDTSPALEEWHRVLKVGGRIIIAVPDINQAVAFVDAGIWTREFFLANVYGSQVMGDVPAEMFTHFQIFTPKLLIETVGAYFDAVGIGCDGAPRQPSFGEVVVQGTKV